jgi:2-dehydropantoate 2-reductase
MRFVVYGAGAIGGVIGGRLFEAGHDVTLVARGEHGRVLRERGLRLATPEGEVELPVPVVEHPSEATLRDDDVVLLAMKSQDTPDAVATLRAFAPPGIRLVCAQNGVENERVALRSFPHVYAMVVMCPATFLQPGRVVAHSSPCPGILDLGSYPNGTDATAQAVARALSASGFVSEPRRDILRWKYRKLIMNLANAAVAVCGPEAPLDPLLKTLWKEGEACLAAAGLDVVSREDDRERRGTLISIQPVAGIDRPGGSSWQSLARGAGTIESDYLNGEIVLLGRLHGAPTPANNLVRQLANGAAAARQPPGSVTVDQVLAEIVSSSG